MTNNKTGIVTFEGLDGELKIALPDRIFPFPHLIRLGDGSLWQFNRQTWMRDIGYKAQYKPAKVEHFNWVHPSPLGVTENIGSIDTQSAEDKRRKLGVD